MYISKKNKKIPNKIKKTKKDKRVKRGRTSKSSKIFFDEFKSLKGKIPKYAGKKIPTKFTDIRGKMEYHSNPGIKEELKNLHKGQRKLMVMELDFINYCWPEIVKRGIEDKVVFVYVGAAPSNHTTLLADLFPKWKFILYDPRPMHPAVKKYKNIEERIQFFMDEDCDEFAKIADRVLFVSDIRDMTVAKDETNNKHLRENLIFNDMKMQMDWVKKINPVASSLKFRLPYQPGTTSYLDGELKLQCWAPKESTEGRLFVPHPKNGKFKMKKYDNTTHEQRSFYFNNKIRKSFFPHNSICYQHNYDSAREYIINREFVEKVLGFKSASEDKIQNRVFKMMKDINYCVRLPKSVLPILSPHANKVKYNL
jgi:hypothetical protein